MTSEIKLNLALNSALSALTLIATPKRSDGTYNRCRSACETLAKNALQEVANHLCAEQATQVQTAALECTGSDAISAIDAPAIAMPKLEVDDLSWHKEMPRSLGFWWMKCFETDYAPEIVRIFSVDNVGSIMVDDSHLGRLALDHLANGLTDVSWAPTPAGYKPTPGT